MNFMSANSQSHAAMAREVKLAVGELSRLLSNCFNDALKGLTLDQRRDQDVSSRHGLR